jgi:hypothetical protein
MDELKRKNWDAIGKHLARGGKEYIDRYVRCLTFIIPFCQRYLADAEREVPAVTVTLSQSLSVKLHRRRLRGSQSQLKTPEETQTRYLPDSL